MIWLPCQLFCSTLPATTHGHFSHLPPSSRHCFCTPGAMTKALPLAAEPKTSALHKGRAGLVLLCIVTTERLTSPGNSWTKHEVPHGLSRYPLHHRLHQQYLSLIPQGTSLPLHCCLCALDGSGTSLHVYAGEKHRHKHSSYHQTGV